VAPLLESEKGSCPLSDSSNGEIVPGSRLKAGMEAGEFFNIDPKTGKRAKPKRS
jgi:hypothetical protein